MARRLREPNRRLAALIAEAGFSSKGLARRVVDRGRSRGYRNLKYNHSSVERWLRGEQPRPPTPELLGEVFSAALARPVSLAMLGMAQERTPDSAALQHSADSYGCRAHCSWPHRGRPEASARPCHVWIRPRRLLLRRASLAPGTPDRYDGQRRKPQDRNGRSPGDPRGDQRVPGTGQPAWWRTHPSDRR